MARVDRGLKARACVAVTVLTLTAASALVSGPFRHHPVERVLSILPVLALGFLALPVRAGSVSRWRRSWRLVLGYAAVIAVGGGITVALRLARMGFARFDPWNCAAWFLLLAGTCLPLLLVFVWIHALARGRRAVVLVGWLVALLLLAPPTVVLLFAHPPRFPPRGSPAGLGLAFREVRIPSRGGREIAAWYLPGAPGAPALVVSHGIGANRADPLPHAPVLGRGLDGRRRHLLLLDLGGHGESEGHTIGFGLPERLDVMACFDWLLRETDCDPERLGAYGFSMGASTVLLAAADDPRIRVVIADAPFRSLRALAERWLVYAGPLTPFVRWSIEAAFRQVLDAEMDAVSPEAAMPRLGDRQVLFIHGEADLVAPVSHGRALYERKRDLEGGGGGGEGRSELYLHPGRHNSRHEEDPATFGRRVEAFLARNLDASGGARGPSLPAEASPRGDDPHTPEPVPK